MGTPVSKIERTVRVRAAPTMQYQHRPLRAEGGEIILLVNAPRVWRWGGVIGLIPRGGVIISSRRLVLAGVLPGRFLRDVI